jgi:adenylate kinase family enzyme
MPVSNLQRKDLQRTNVIGTSGSGKSTFARRLASLTDQPYIEMDRLYWQPNWTESSVDQLRERLRVEIARDRWIIDGNYHSKTNDLKWANATAIIWLNMPFLTTLWRAIRRATHRAWTKQEVWPGTGNRESFRQSFASRDSVVLWTLTTYHSTRRRYIELMENPTDHQPKITRLESSAEAANFLRRIAIAKQKSTVVKCS